MICYTLIPSPLGEITAASENGHLTALWLPTQPGICLADAQRKDDEPVLTAVREWLRRYFDGEIMECRIPMAPRGTPFQLRVWEILRQIPYGETTTYGRIAGEFGRMSAQAVGQAVGRNPISILIPCHRVLGAGQKLTGYTGGIEKKMILLETEHIPYKR